MKNFDLKKLVRPNVWEMKAYSSARDEFEKTSGDTIFLDANENALGSPLRNQDFSRYPDPHQRKLKSKLADIKSVSDKQIFVGNGSDEAIDLLFRIFCIPQKDNIIINPPTYGMYKVSAALNDIEVREAQLTNDLELDLEAIRNQIDENTKLIFVCTPNNPTGNSLEQNRIISLIESFDGIIVIDEAYIDFAPAGSSFLNIIEEYPNVVVLQTLSKAWGLAGIRLGMAFSNPEIINLYKKVKPPYNVNVLTQQIAFEALQNSEKAQENVNLLNEERSRLTKELPKFDFVESIFESDTNFLLVRMQSPKEVYQFLVENHQLVVRDRSKEPLCEGCLRITVGTPTENDALLSSLEQYQRILQEH